MSFSIGLQQSTWRLWLFLGIYHFCLPWNKSSGTSPDTCSELPIVFLWTGRNIFPGLSLFPANLFNVFWTEPIPFIASALLFYRAHLDTAGGRHILIGVLLSSSLCSAKASLCGWEWPLDEKPIRLGQKQLQLRADGTETILWLVLGGTAQEASEKPVCPSKAVPRWVLTYHALSYSSSHEWNHRGGIPCAECLLSLNGTNSERVCPSDWSPPATVPASGIQTHTAQEQRPRTGLLNLLLNKDSPRHKL